MDLLATPEQLAAWLEENLDDSYERAVAVLDHASSLVRIEAQSTFVSPAVVPDGIPQLVVRVAARMWPNPTGLRSSTTGPFSGTFGDFALTDAEKSEVWQIMHPGQRRGLGTISTTRGPLETGTVYVAVEGQPEAPFPLLSPEPW